MFHSNESSIASHRNNFRGGQVGPWCFSMLGVLLILFIVGQVSVVLGAGWELFYIFLLALTNPIFPFLLSL